MVCFFGQPVAVVVVVDPLFDGEGDGRGFVVVPAAAPTRGLISPVLHQRFVPERHVYYIYDDLYVMEEEEQETSARALVVRCV